MKNTYIFMIFGFLMMALPVSAQQYADEIERDVNDMSGYILSHNHDRMYPTISIYPNPARDILRIRLPDYQGNEIFVYIMNQSGQVLIREEFFNMSTIDTEIEISVEPLSPGTYFLKVEHDNMLDSKRVVIE